MEADLFYDEYTESEDIRNGMKRKYEEYHQAKEEVSQAEEFLRTLEK